MSDTSHDRPAATAVTLRGVRKRFGSVDVIHGVDLAIEPGEFTVFVGPSGCGKSTLLRMIAGLEEISDGTIELGGERMNEVPAARRGIAMVFQSYALYPHMTVFQNLAFGLETARIPRPEIETRVAEVARILQIEPLLKRKPRQLSGGQRQRVAIGRAIVREPRLFLFDEPLSNLDAELRVQMRVEIARLHRSLGSTMIYVTHDQVEAMTMADKIVVLNAGRIEQTGSPLELYNRPANRFVAGFIGSPRMNFLTWDRGQTETPLTPAVRELIQLPPGGEVTVGIRPEHLGLKPGDDRVQFASVEVSIVENLGNQTQIYAALADGQPITAVVDGQQSAHPGARIDLFAHPSLFHVFDAEGMRL